MPAGGCASAVTLDATTNVWAKYTLHPTAYYKAEVTAAIGNLSDKSLANAAAVVAGTGTFLWIDSIASIARIETNVADVPCDHILGLVIYNIPGRDCAAKASNGELKTGDIARYQSEFIDRESSSSHPLPAPIDRAEEGKRGNMVG